MAKILPTKKTAETVLNALLSSADLQFLTKKAKVVLMVGMPGSGKSTLSQLLSSAHGFWRFSSDQIRIEELFPGQEHRLASEHDQVMLARHQVYQELARRVARAVAQGQRVVVDSTNLDDKREMILRSLLEVTQPESIALICVQTPEEVMLQRFHREGNESAQKWRSVYEYWKTYLAEGKAKFPVPGQYSGVRLCLVQRYDLETFDWITDTNVIVWDVDRTLYQPLPAINDAVQDYLLGAIEQSLGLDRAAAQEQFHLTYERQKSTTATLDALGLNGRAVIDQAFQQIPLERHLKPDLRLKQLFQKLSQFHHVVLSNGSLISTRRKLKALGLPPSTFSAIYATYELPVMKPDPQVFQHVIKQTGFAPHQHLMVGDKLNLDILPAKAAGMRTALIGDAHESADVCFETAHQVGRLFGIEV